MANEISASVSCAISSLGQTVNGNGTFQATIGGGGFLGNEQTIGTAAENLVIGDVTIPAAVFIKNLDNTNFVQVDAVAAMTSFPQKLLPGQAILLLPTSGTIWCKADTANVKIWSVVG